MTTVLKAKCIIPDIPPGALISDRIRGLDIAVARAVIITAPAGYGKTTAVLLSLRHARENTHWYRLEKEDAALPVFFAHLIETLFGNADEKTDSERSLASIGNITEEYSLLSAVVCQDAWSLYTCGDKPRYLVFDDFQNVAESPAICEILRYFVTNMPPGIHIIVISRAQTGIRTEKLNLSGEVAFIDGEKLLFSREEIELLFSGAGEPETGLKYAGEVFDYTEGWIAGVTLMRHMVNRREVVEKKDFRDDRQRIFRYLAGEVFANADRDMVLAAARISLLEEWSGEDLAGIFRFDDPEGTISWLQKSNFYINKINTVPASYRFHSLFRDALRYVLAGAYTKDEIAGFHLSAAAYYEKTGRYQLAVIHYLFGADEKNAVRTAAEKGFALMDNGDIRSAAGLIRPLPEHLIFGNATLLMIFGCALSGTETEKSFALLIKAIEMAVKNRDLNLAVKTQGFAISICVQQNNFHKIKDVIGLVPMSKALRDSKQARRMLIHSLFLKFSTSFKIKPAKALCRIVDKVNMDEREELWQFSTLLSKALLYAVTGDFRESEKTLLGLTGHPVALTNDRWRAFGLQLSCLLTHAMGEKDPLLNLANELTSLGLKYADGFAASYGAYYTAMAKYQGRDLAGAALTADKAEKLFIQNRNLTMAILTKIVLHSWQAELDETSGSAAYLDEQVAALEAAGGNANFVAGAKTFAAVQHMKEGALDKAEGLLLESWKWEKSIQALQALCSIAMHLSELYYKKNDLRREEEYLKFFGETAAKKGYVFFREMRFDSLVRACARCAEKNIALQHMANLVGRYFGFDAASELLKRPHEIAADPGAFVMRFPANPKPGAKSVWVKLFGSFGLTVDGSEIAPDVFKTRKISGIFRYILAEPSHIFSREELAAAFWPDSGGKEAANSLRVALFELRKTLAALDMAFDSESALVAESGSGFYVCRPETVESDAARFARLYDQLQSGLLTENGERAALYELTNLYDGDYLEDSIAENCAAIRMDYRTAFAKASYRLLEIYRGEGQKDLAEALMQKKLKVMDAGLTQEEIKVAQLMLDGLTKRDISRKFSMSKEQVEQYEKAIRLKLNLLGSPDPEIAAAVAEYKLTKRETDMLKYLRDGATTEEISDELLISAETVRYHTSNLLKKLGIKNRQDVRAWLDRYKTG